MDSLLCSHTLNFFDLKPGADGSTGPEVEYKIQPTMAPGHTIGQCILVLTLALDLQMPLCVPDAAMRLALRPLDCQKLTPRQLVVCVHAGCYLQDPLSATTAQTRRELPWVRLILGSESAETAAALSVSDPQWGQQFCLGVTDETEGGCLRIEVYYGKRTECTGIGHVALAELVCNNVTPAFVPLHFRDPTTGLFAAYQAPGGTISILQTSALCARSPLACTIKWTIWGGGSKVG